MEDGWVGLHHPEHCKQVPPAVQAVESAGVAAADAAARVFVTPARTPGPAVLNLDSAGPAGLPTLRPGRKPSAGRRPGCRARRPHPGSPCWEPFGLRAHPQPRSQPFQGSLSRPIITATPHSLSPAHHLPDLPRHHWRVMFSHGRELVAYLVGTAPHLRRSGLQRPAGWSECWHQNRGL